jgi:hypothetical protein
MSLSTFLPVAPFYGIAQTGGAINAPGVVQLYNPPGSGVTAVIYEMTVQTPIGLVNATRPPNIRMRRSTATMQRGLGFTEGIYSVIRPDPSYTSASSVSFTAFNFPSGASVFQDDVAQWLGFTCAEGQDGWAPTYVRLGHNAFPVTVQPSTAVEFQPNYQGVTNIITVTMLWSEVT